MANLYVTRPTDISDSRSRYLHDFRPAGMICAEPGIGDQVIDILDVRPTGDGNYAVHSRARLEEIKLESAWSWGDQYEEGAEYDLAQECLRAYHGEETCLNLENGPLFPLVYPRQQAIA